MEKRYSLRAMITLAVFASAFTCIVLFFTMGRDLGVFTDRFDGIKRYGVLLEKIEEMYIGDYDNSTVTDEALRGAVYALGDDWSYYMSPDEYYDYLNYSNNQYVGIGVEVEVGEDLDGMLVMAVYPGSPAEISGLEVSDVVTAVDGVPLKGLSLEEIDVIMAREIGETMELTVAREEDILTFETEYGLIYKDPVTYELLTDEIGYIALENFDFGAANGFIYATKELRELGATAFIFDVRSNGGGKVSELTYILDYLLPKGDIFVEVDGNGREDVIKSDDKWLDMPAVVLVNGYSYSAAEYFAVMLSEYEYAVTVGEHTTGKNRSQLTIELPDGGALHISTAEYLTKNRISLHDTQGYAPDYEVAMTDDDYVALYYGMLSVEDDLQLQKAISLLSQ